MPGVVEAIAWPRTRSPTIPNGYKVTPLLVTCVILWRLSSTGRWCDATHLFGNFIEELSEVFWEGTENFLENRKHLIVGGLNSSFLRERARMYADSIMRVSPTLSYCVGFIDGTELLDRLVI